MATGAARGRTGAKRGAPARARGKAGGAGPKKPRAQSSKRRASPRRRPGARRAARGPAPQPPSDLVIVDDNLGFDPQKENAERRAYLEEARSQDATD